MDFLLTHFELSACHMRLRGSTEGMTMADRGSLKFVGFIFATVTMAVMLTATMVVKSYADGVYTIEDTAFVRQ
jgi:hypothetical protein